MDGAVHVPCSPVLFQILSRRGLVKPEAIEEFLYPGYSSFLDPFLMKGMKEAVQLIRLHLSVKSPILIHGDYDVDGITSSAILSRTISKLGAAPQVFLPDRAEDGYGVSEKAIRTFAKEGGKLLLTADCGITARPQIAVARELGLQIIILDHHQIPESGVPAADVILNPAQADCGYPFKHLTAGGLAFKLSQALIGVEAFELLDLAALSTVCDVAPLLEENRVIVKKGLELISKRNRIGLRALIEKSALKSNEITSTHLGFVLGPRINAAGRMSSPDIALRLLITDSIKEAESLAGVLEAENKIRQNEEKRVLAEALREAERTFNFNRDRVIVVGREHWHAGVIGIVASRLVDRYYRPAVVIAFDQGKGKGSGRSIKNFHLYEALAASKAWLTEFGGHEQAAGLHISAESMSGFRAEINRYGREQVDPAVYHRQLSFDLELDFGQIKHSLLEELKLLEPHGQQNPKPVFLCRSAALKKLDLMPFSGKRKVMLTEGGVTFYGYCNDEMLSDAGFHAGQELGDLYYSIKQKDTLQKESVEIDIKGIKLPR